MEEALADAKCVLPVGNRTKSPLCRADGATLVSLSAMTGIIEYEPSEFTFTARAGTPLAEISAALAQRGQYLPFDPLLVHDGATIGGTVGTNVAGPGRFRYGGIRDFLLGARLLCGDGRWANVGGKVVKNAAGFDIHKLLVGSLGRLGLMTELTFKVFPKPEDLLTLLVRCESHEVAIERIVHASTSRWELDAIDYRPNRQELYLRLGGPHDVNASIAQDIQTVWGKDVVVLDLGEADAFWRSVIGLSWNDAGPQHAATVIKVPTTLNQFASLQDTLGSESAIELHLSVAGSVTWIACNRDAAPSSIDGCLIEFDLRGLSIRGETDRVWLGTRWHTQMERSIKEAMDPQGKFPHLDDRVHAH